MFRRVLFKLPSGAARQIPIASTPSAVLKQLTAIRYSSGLTYNLDKLREQYGPNPEFYIPPERACDLPSTWPAKKCEFQDFTMVKEGESPRGPQAEYPELKYHMPFDTSKYRCYMIPEAYFNFLYERTGVLGPYMLFWGSLITMMSKEIIMINEEFGAAIMFLIAPIWLASKLAPGIDKATRSHYNTKMLTLEKLKKSKVEQFSNEADALEEDEKRAEAGKEIFNAYTANVENMIEAEFRQRQEQVYQSFKRRLDYQVALQGLEEGLVQRQLVAWVKGEVDKSLKARSQKEDMNQCLNDLKSLAAAQ